MLKKLQSWIIGAGCDLRERTLRAILVIGGAAAFLGITEAVILVNAKFFLLAIVLVALISSVILGVFLKKSDIETTAILVGIILNVFVFPFLFFTSGGIDGGDPIWFVLGIYYVFIMFSGKVLYIFLTVTFVSYGATYLTAYFWPDLIFTVFSREIIYIDSFFSIFVVGTVCGLVIRLQMKIYDREHKQALKQKEELQQTSSSRNVFFANMSHEIRTPINTIIGLNEMMLRENLSDDVREYAQDIQVASELLLGQVNDILDLSQMEMDKMTIVPINYQTKELFADLVDMMWVRMKKKELDFFVNVDNNLPSVLFGDEKRIRQVLLNILDNAVKYTKQGSVTMSVEGETEADGMLSLKVKIADTGIGIRKEDMEHIYDYFNRADEKKNRKIIGSGLGLAITKQLVELMGGEITVDSIYTKGTIFTIILHQKIVNTEPVGQVNFMGRKNTEGTGYRPSFEAPEARVLVVDDNAMNAKVIKRLLQATKVQIDIAMSGQECLEKTHRKYYNVILLDYMMPDMDGLETLKAIRTQENGLCRNTPVVALTANAMSGARLMYQERGFDDYAEKPIQGKVLEATVMKFLSSDIIEYQENEQIEAEGTGQMQKLTVRKRKKIYITSDCTCDIPQEYVEEFDIKLMYLYIKTPHGRFADTKEIDSDSLMQYLSTVQSSAYADSVTVEEYEQFFADVLTQAEVVIHISLASRSGESYRIAVNAAKCFDHVYVVDSEQISGGEGLLTLYAAKLAMEGKSAAQILEAVEKKKSMIQTRIIMPGIDIFFQNGRTRAITAKICHLIHFHPYVAMRQKKAAIVGLLAGSQENAWKQGIHWHLRKKKKINKEVVFITHVCCSVKQLEWIQQEVLKCVPFKRVIIQKTSFSNACNSGLESIGIAYYTL